MPPASVRPPLPLCGFLELEVRCVLMSWLVFSNSSQPRGRVFSETQTPVTHTSHFWEEEMVHMGVRGHPFPPQAHAVPEPYSASSASGQLDS